MGRFNYNEWQRSSEQVLVSAFSGSGEQVVAEGYTPLSAVLDGEDEEVVAKLLASSPETKALILSTFAEDERAYYLDLIGRDDEEVAQQAAEEIVRAIRVDTLQTVTRFVWRGARTPWHALKNFLAMVRGVMPSIMGGIGVRQMSVVLNETPAATSAREKKLEEIAKEWGIVGVRISGVKTGEACEAYSKAQEGNKCRKGGKRVA